MAGLSQSYSTNMPDWVIAKYVDPEAKRHQLLLHDYQQTEIQKMRSMENTKLVDSLHLPLKSSEDLLFAELYCFLFGNKTKLAKKPLPWRVSLLLEVLYGGWTLVRDKQ